MMGLDTIRQMADEAAEAAARDGSKPYVYWDSAEVDRLGVSPIPFLGSHVPEGWELVEEFFVDSSGFGSPGEPAMTIPAFLERVKRTIESAPDHYQVVGWAVVQAGQFQVYVGEYRK